MSARFLRRNPFKLLQGERPCECMWLYEDTRGLEVVAESTGKTEIARIPIKRIREYIARLDRK